LLPSLIKSLVAREESFPMGSGRQLRDFVDVQEVARQMLTLAIHQDASGVYNVGSGIARSVLEIAEEAIAAHGGTIRLDRGVYPDRADEPLAFWAHMDRYKALQATPQTHP
jgi:dTDP-6-deoxy-L-talose 4-dehydrogenase (NAD+)